MNNGILKQIKEFLLNFNYKQLYWLFEMGRPLKKADIFLLRENNFSIMQKPVFFLSTGRSGTMWFAKLLMQDKNSKIYHFAPPDLAIQAKEIFKFKESLFNEDSVEFKLITEMFLVAREEYFINSYKANKRYIETNNHLVSFAPIIAKLIPQAIFIHIYRHPGEYVRSGLRRGWYQYQDLSRRKLIEPLNIPEWDSFSQIQKISWQWNEINQFIENFKNTISPTKYFEYNFNELNLQNTKKMVDFIGLNITENNIKKNLKRKVNVQKSGDISLYKNWDNKDKEDLKNICGELAGKYGFRL